MRHIRKILASLRKADELFSLIDNGDSIALGISGGKDSLCLMQAMHLYRKFSGKDFSITPICLDLGFDGFDATPVKQWIAELGYDLKIIDSTEVFPILKANAKDEKHLPCSICSRMKKAAINAAAHEYQCKKVAFAHHKDDAVETLMMNMIHGGRVATFEPKMHLDRADITFIRPLIFARESDLAAMVAEENLPVLPRVCPVDGITERSYVKKRLQSLYSERPEAEANLASMLYNYEDFGLYFSHIEKKEMTGSLYSFTPLSNAKQAIAYQAYAAKNSLPLLLSEAQDIWLLKKEHAVLGAISFLEESHEIRILAFDLPKEKEEEANAFLSLFIKFKGREHNPCLFLYEGKGHEDAFVSNGFKEVALSEGKGFALRIFR